MSATELKIFRLEHSSGAYVELTSMGASWISAVMPDREGKLADVLLGYPTIEGFLSDPNYMGRTIGRFANRIKDASFALDGKEYKLDRNDGQNCNHSGCAGFSHKLFDAEQLADNAVRFSLVSEDGDGGFPGEVHLTVTYTLTDALCLKIDYEATTTEVTPLNLTNHAYFNLDAEGDILSHELMIPTDRMLEADEAFIPSGKVVDVRGGAFDFLHKKPVGRDIDMKNEQFVWNRGYNHCYLFTEERRDEACGLRAELSSRKSGRCLRVYSTLPAMQVYTGGYLDSETEGRFGRRVQPSDGVALEAQFCPDSPNKPQFPSCILQKGERYMHTIIFAFTTL